MRLNQHDVRNVAAVTLFMINLYMNPCRAEDYPTSGGVREHIIQLRKQLEQSAEIQLLPYRAFQMAHVQHIEATYTPLSTDVPIVYVCHGGFVPYPLPAVMRNLKRAGIIVTVADWLIKRFAPAVLYKTVVIPNGIDLTEFENLPHSGFEPGYVLYGKEWTYYFEDFIKLAESLPQQRFLTTAWPAKCAVPYNVTYIGRQSSQNMKSIIKDAGLVILTGSEVCPTLMLEAWAAGTPVLARAIDGNVELMQPYNDGAIGGMLYNDIKEAVQYVPIILYYRNIMGMVGRQHVEAHYQWCQLVKSYEDVYNQLMEKL